MNNKNLLTVGLVGGLLLTNSVTVYQWKKDVSKLDLEIYKQEEIINRQQGRIHEGNNLLEKQQVEINTYKETESKLNNQIKNKDYEIEKLKKELEVTKKRVKESP